MMKNKLFKIMLIISMIIEILVFIMVNFIYKNTYEVYNSTNYLALAVIELINIIFGILLFNKKNNKLIKILYIVFIIITFVMLAAAIFVFIKMPITPHYRGLRVVLCTLAAGAVGNLIDRIHNGYVHDFIYFKIINFPVFNFADICVTLSMIGLVIMILFVYKDKDWDFLKKKKAEEQPSDASGDEDGK